MMRFAILLSILLAILVVPGMVSAQSTNISGSWVPERVVGLTEVGPAVNLTGNYGILTIDEVSGENITGNRIVTKDTSSVTIPFTGTLLPDESGFIIFDKDGGMQFAKLTDAKTITLYVVSPFPKSPEATAEADVIVLTLKKGIPEKGVLIGAMQSAYNENQQDLSEAEMAGKESNELYGVTADTTECDDDGCYCDGEGCQCTGPDCYCEGGNCVQDGTQYSCSGWDCWLTCNAGKDCSMET